jgi:predicted DNA-binding WGR domain protein
MRVQLEKQNRKTIDFVSLELDDVFIRKTWGKIGKSGNGSSTLKSHSIEGAKNEINNQIEEYKKLGYKIALTQNSVEKNITFDKAKWHINEEFPEELDSFQSYVHTGMYICWLIEKGLTKHENPYDDKESLERLKVRVNSPANYYFEQMDGVFDCEGLTVQAKEFTKTYFDFEKGNYLNDYIKTLDPTDELPTLFHIKDSWQNYDKLKQTLNQEYNNWKKNHNSD